MIGYGNDYTSYSVIIHKLSSRVAKTFLLHAHNDILPTKEHLFKQHITLDPLCPICGLGTETLGYILWSCSLRCVVEVCSSYSKDHK
jgi:hypothetical protein